MSNENQARKQTFTCSLEYQNNSCNESDSEKESLLVRSHDDLFNEYLFLCTQRPLYKRCGSYQCEECNKNFNTIASFMEHKLLHKLKKSSSNDKCKQNRMFHCEKCDKKFTRLFNLIQHKRKHFEEVCYECDICNKIFNKETLRNIHKQSHNSFKKRLGSSHKSKHKKCPNKIYYCKKCDKNWADEADFAKHKEVHNCLPFDSAANKPVDFTAMLYDCDICMEKFVNEVDLITHKNTHEYDVSKICSEKIKNKNDCVKHQEIHSSEDQDFIGFASTEMNHCECDHGFSNNREEKIMNLTALRKNKQINGSEGNKSSQADQNIHGNNMNNEDEKKCTINSSTSKHEEIQETEKNPLNNIKCTEDVNFGQRKQINCTKYRISISKQDKIMDCKFQKGVETTSSEMYTYKQNKNKSENDMLTSSNTDRQSHTDDKFCCCIKCNTKLTTETKFVEFKEVQIKCSKEKSLMTNNNSSETDLTKHKPNHCSQNVSSLSLNCKQLEKMPSNRRKYIVNSNKFTNQTDITEPITNHTSEKSAVMSSSNSKKYMDYKLQDETAASSQKLETSLYSENYKNKCKEIEMNIQNEPKNSRNRIEFTEYENKKKQKKLFHCRVCNAIFTTYVGFMNHNQRHSNKTNKTVYCCTTCQKSFSRYYDLLKHRQVHTRAKSFHSDLHSKFIQKRDHVIHKYIYFRKTPCLQQVYDKNFI